MLSRINIALVPPKEISELSIQKSRELSEKFETHFVLNGVDLIPHMTIYSPAFPEENSKQVFAEMVKIAQNTSQLTCKINGIDEIDGFLGYAIEKSPQLLEFHEQIVKTLNPLRKTGVEQAEMNMGAGLNFSDAELEMLREYGYPLVLDQFQPHITVTRMVDMELAKQIAEEMTYPTDEFVISHVGCYAMGDNGTCVEELRKFEFS